METALARLIEDHDGFTAEHSAADGDEQRIEFPSHNARRSFIAALEALPAGTLTRGVEWDYGADRSVILVTDHRDA